MTKDKLIEEIDEALDRYLKSIQGSKELMHPTLVVLLSRARERIAVETPTIENVQR